MSRVVRSRKHGGIDRITVCRVDLREVRDHTKPTRVRLANAIGDSMTGNSVSTLTTVASAGHEVRPKTLNATATANSMEFDVPISSQVAAILWGTHCAYPWCRLARRVRIHQERLQSELQTHEHRHAVAHRFRDQTAELGRCPGNQRHLMPRPGRRLEFCAYGRRRRSQLSRLASTSVCSLEPYPRRDLSLNRWSGWLQAIHQIRAFIRFAENQPGETASKPPGRKASAQPLPHKARKQ